MQFIERLYECAKRNKKRIILPEGEEIRVLKAVEVILKKDICIPVLLGNPDKILKLSKNAGIDLKPVEIIAPRNYKDFDRYVGLYCEIRKHKGVKKEEAQKLIIQNPVFYSALAVRAGDADGFVAGAATTTRDVARSAIYCIGAREGILTVSSSTIIILQDTNFGAKGVFIYADASIVPAPTATELRDIALSSVKMARMIFNEEPKVAMLSYSTKGSGGSRDEIEKVREATRLVIEKEPDLLIDGEIQLDCAVVTEVTERKDPNSRIKGRANILIFPNLDAGNIAYKLTERFAHARAIGPILQGLKKPASDLSRGCDSQGIVDAVSVVAVLAQDTQISTD